MHREVTFTPQLGDHFAGQRLFYARYLRRGWGLAVLIAMAFVELGSLASFAFDLTRGETLGTSVASHLVVILAPIVVLGITVWNWHRIPAQVRRMAEQQPSLFSETTWRWDDSMLVAESAAGTSRIDWASLYGWLASDSSIVVRPQERIVLILPRRVLTVEQDTDLLAVLDRFAVKARRS